MTFDKWIHVCYPRLDHLDPKDISFHNFFVPAMPDWGLQENTVIKLRKAREDEISSFVEIEKLDGTSGFIIPYSVEQHHAEMHKPNVVYLSIVSKDTLLGFIILATGDDSESVEFRRIVVASKGNGTGQSAISEMERYCADVLKCNRIWLDVFEINKRGQHIYNKLGYRQFKTGEHNGKALLYFDKKL